MLLSCARRTSPPAETAAAIVGREIAIEFFAVR